LGLARPQKSEGVTQHKETNLDTWVFFVESWKQKKKINKTEPYNMYVITDKDSLEARRVQPPPAAVDILLVITTYC
jgi:hypothetical protein